MEAELEEWLVANLDALAPLGLHVRLAEPTPGVSGLQWRCGNGSARLDFLLEATAAGSTDDAGTVVLELGDLVVVEPKVTPLHPSDVDQIVRYRDIVESELPGDGGVWAVLVGAGASSAALDAYDANGGDCRARG